MKHTDLKINEEVYKGNSMHANRLLRKENGTVEVQHIYRYGKPSDTTIMTLAEFDEWQELIKKV